MGPRFVNSFIVQIDVIFNINELNIFLSIFIGITNIMSGFSLAYSFLSFEFIEVVKFVNTYCKNLFFEMITRDLQ